MNKLSEFTIDNQTLPVTFIETLTVKEGVKCDVYTFVGDNSKDLAIVTVERSCKTPLQRVLMGARTIEGYVAGEGALTVRSKDEEVKTYEFGPRFENTEVIVGVGQIMQWYANGDHDLIFYEICEPSYESGRFENL